MKTYTVEISKRAKADLTDYHNHIAADSPTNAKRWLEGALKKASSLAIFPLRCALISEARELNVELRETFYKSHRIIYKIDGDMVRIVTVYHGSRDRLTAEDLTE
jgi:plasmid stabilization system protein ParE